MFWALKGGGPNFGTSPNVLTVTPRLILGFVGVVTRFDLYTVPVRDIWYSVIIYSTEQVPAILSAFVEWQENGASDPKGTVGLIIGLESITILLIYSEPAENTPTAFSPFQSITPVAVAVPPVNGTLLSISQLLATTFSTEPQR